MEDKKIILLLWVRAENAIDALGKKFGKRLMMTAMSILGVWQDAEEAVNDTYLALWNTIPPQDPDPLAGYVYATGRNISLDRLKYNTAQKRDGRYALCMDELAEYIPSCALEETVEARELGLAIDSFLSKLSADNRRLFLRRYWFGDSLEQIAVDLKLRPNTAAVRLKRIRKRLRDYLIREGFLDERETC